MSWLKQSTAVTVKIGPFLDETDAKTAETALTIAQADVRLSKNGGNIAQKNEATTCTHDELGIYDCPLNATDTNTVGVLELFVHESGALPVWREFTVVPANVYDSLIGGSDLLQTDVAAVSDDTTAADRLETMLDGTGGNKLHLAGLVIVAANNDDAIIATGSGTGHGINATGGATNGAGIRAEGVSDGAGIDAAGGDTGYGMSLTGGLYALVPGELPAIILENVGAAGDLFTGNGVSLAGGGAGGAVDIASIDASTTAAENLRKAFSGEVYNASGLTIAVVGTVTNTVTADIAQIGSDAGRMTRLYQLLGAITYSTAKTGTLTTTVFTTNLTETTNDHYVGATIKFISGALAGQLSFVTDYDGGTKALTVSPALTEAPANTDGFILL